MPHFDDHEASARAVLWATVWAVVILGFAVGGVWQNFPAAKAVIAVVGGH